MSNTFICPLFWFSGKLPQAWGRATRREGHGALGPNLDALEAGNFDLLTAVFSSIRRTLGHMEGAAAPNQGGPDQTSGKAALDAFLLHFYLFFACILCVRPAN